MDEAGPNVSAGQQGLRNVESLLSCISWLLKMMMNRVRPIAPAVRTRHGLALILVAGVLGILAVLATAFVTMAQLERKASAQRLNATRAALLARGGLEDALARLSAGQDPGLPGNAYRGEDWDDDGAVIGLESAAEVYGPGQANLLDCPVQHALRPSFFQRHPSDLDSQGRPAPDRLRIEGRERGMSGHLYADTRAAGHTYALKVEDESGKINVNGGFLDAQDRDDVNQDGISEGDGIPDHQDPFVTSLAVAGLPAAANGIGRGWNAQLVRVLNLLGMQPEVGVPNLGTLTLQGRPPGGYRSITALQQRLGTTKDLSPYLTVSSWVDAKVVHPNGYAGQASVYSHCDVKKTRAPLALEEGGRPPVNLNAASRPVLLALLVSLQGTTWYHPRYPRTYMISPAMARAIAAAMIAARPFGSWGEFGAFCDGLVPTAISGMDASSQGGGNLCGADLLKANFDPNTLSNKELPDQLMWRWIDKSDLTIWSTEGCLSPTGTFRVSATGRLLDGRGRLVAEAGASTTVEAFRPARQTTQKDFVAGRTYLGDYLSLATGSLDPTDGATASAAWWGGPPPGTGLAAMTYPCAPLALQAGNAAETDGAIGLATVQVPEGMHDPTFVHHFDDSWNADVPAGSPDRTELRVLPYPGGARLQTDLARGVWPPPPTGTEPYPTEPSTFYPDGIHIQEGRSPAYQALGNLPLTITSDVTGTTEFDNHAAISYWVKPVIHLGFSRPGVWWAAYDMDNQLTFDFSCIRTNPDGSTHALMIGRSANLWGMMIERYAPLGDPYDLTDGTRMERYDVDGDPVATTDISWIYLPGARWFLATAHWSTLDQDAGDQADIFYQGVRGESLPYMNGHGGFSVYGLAMSSLCENLTPDATVSMLLGGQETAGFTVLTLKAARPAYGNQVLDEFAVYGFDRGDNKMWFSERWKAGRYCKQDALFLSGVVEPDPGRPARLLRVDWTGYLPRETRKELGDDPAWQYNVLAVPDGYPVPAVGVDRLVDPALDDAPAPAMRIEMELLEETGTLASPAIRALSRGGDVGTTRQRFRYRARFRTTLEDPDDDPVLESPWLDDVTFFWQAATGPRVLAWSRL